MRHEFSARTKRDARKRAGGHCEAEGAVYGLPPGKRCNRPLGPSGGQVDHYPLPAHVEGSDVLTNAVVCCEDCHLFKTRTFDIPAEAKIKRTRRKFGLDPDNRRPRPRMKGRDFPPGHRPMRGRSTFQTKRQ